MINSWSSSAAILFVGAPYLLSIGAFAYSLYLTRHLDTMLNALKNCSYIVTWGASLRQQGWIARSMLVAMIGGLVMCPGPGIRARVMDATDIKNFPPRLKRLLMIDVVLGVVSFSWMVIAYVLVKFM